MWKILKKAKRKITHSKPFVRLISYLATILIKTYHKTLNIETILALNSKPYINQPVLLAFWHGDQFLLTQLYSLWPAVILTDTSWAGEIQSHIMHAFQFKVVRGSSKHNPTKALVSLKNALKRGYPISLAVDGPRGPRHQAKPGIAFLAQKTGLPILPIVIFSKKHWLLNNTWCHYLLPKPFSTCYIKIGEPLFISETTTEPALKVTEALHNLRKESPL